MHELSRMVHFLMGQASWPSFLVQTSGEGYHPMPWMWGPWLGWMGPVFMLIVPIIVIVCIIFMFRWLSAQSGGGQAPRTGETPMEILKKRYARGEIDKKEFEEKKRDLEG